jgi:hypothetical protein
MSHKPTATLVFESANSPYKDPTYWKLSTHMYTIATGAFMPSARIIDAPVDHHPHTWYKAIIIERASKQFLPLFAESKKHRDEMNCLFSKFKFYSIPLKINTQHTINQKLQWPKAKFNETVRKKTWNRRSRNLTCNNSSNNSVGEIQWDSKKKTWNRRSRNLTCSNSSKNSVGEIQWDNKKTTWNRRSRNLTCNNSNKNLVGETLVCVLVVNLRPQRI